MKLHPIRSDLSAKLIAFVAAAPATVWFAGCTAPEQPQPVEQPAAAAPAQARTSDASKKARALAKADIMALHMGLDAYALNNAGAYPDSLLPLVLKDKNGYSFLNQTTVPRDPWGREYRYEPGPPPNVSTLGADGKPGGTGDDADIDYASIAKKG